jgi:outer membrane protein assembly factor BamB
MRQCAAIWLLAAIVCRPGWCGDWPRFCGPGGRGCSPEKNLPTEFSDETVAWKVPLPGPGPASPIVVGGKVIVTAASGSRQQRLHVVGIDAASGRTCWQRTLWATGPVVHNAFGGVAASTPVSDGKFVFALFSSNDLVCLDLNGNLQWLRGLGYENPRTRNDVGMASSPIVAGDTVIVQLENPGVSFAAGLDTSTGATRWRVDLESGGCWTTPVLWTGTTPADDLVVLQTRSGLTAHEPQSGKQVWSYGQSCSSISSTTAWRDYLFAPIDGLTALRRNGASQGVEPAWHQSSLAPANVSPVVDDGRLYTIKSAGVLACADAATGKTLWQLRLQRGRTGIWATPAVADGHLYAVNHDGLVQIVRLDEDAGHVVSTGQIDSGVLASPAIAEGAVYFRTNTHLWKMACGD